ncbi:MAG: class I SAM-dependent methyltransferase [Chloroflexota bacterium]|nr:class I SAM-dependent methyltransferase [Chloroflexota bacterium]
MRWPDEGLYAGPAGVAIVFGDLGGHASRDLRAAGWDVRLVRPGDDATADDRGEAGAAGVLTIRDDRVEADDASADLVILIDALEYALDDAALLDEAARLVRPGGTLVLRVPGATPLAWLDARNIYRYLSEATGRGTPLPEMRRVGFRRRYAPEEITTLVESAGLRVGESTRGGWGLSELVYLVGGVAFRWARPHPLFDRVRRAYGSLDHAEATVPGTYYLTMFTEKADGMRPRATGIANPGANDRP